VTDEMERIDDLPLKEFHFPAVIHISVSVGVQQLVQTGLNCVQM